MPDLYVYRAVVAHVQDGDTVWMMVDQGFDQWHHGPFRFAGCNANELKDPGGPEARDNLRALLPESTELLIRSLRTNKPIPPDFWAPRWDAIMFWPDGRPLIEQLVAEYWLVPWNGKTKPRPKPPWPRPV